MSWASWRVSAIFSPSRVLKKHGLSIVEGSASGVLGFLSGFALTDLALFAPFALTYSGYAPGAKAPTALLDLAPPKRLRAGERAFLNRPFACDDSWNWSDGVGALKILYYSTVLQCISRGISTALPLYGKVKHGKEEPVMGIQKLSRKNQIVIPKAAREAMRVKGGDKLLVVVKGDVTVVMPEPKSYAKALRGLAKGIYPQGYLKRERKSW